MKHKIKKIFENAVWWSGVIAVGLVLGVSLQFVKAWTEPTNEPPGGNVGAPINTSALGQIKIGALNLLGGLTTGGLRFKPLGVTPVVGQVLSASNASGDVAWRASENFRISCGHDNETLPDEQMAFCCRTQVNNGDTDCKRYQLGSWNFYPKPWSAGAPGKYDISCNHDFDMIMCCREDAITGKTKCKSNGGNPGESWSDYPDPF